MKACLESNALGDMIVQKVVGDFSRRFNSTHPEQAAKLVIEYLRTSPKTCEFPFVQLSECEAYCKMSAAMPEDSELMILIDNKKKIDTQTQGNSLSICISF